MGQVLTVIVITFVKVQVVGSVVGGGGLVVTAAAPCAGRGGGACLQGGHVILVGPQVGQHGLQRGPLGSYTNSKTQDPTENMAPTHNLLRTFLKTFLNQPTKHVL